MIDKGMWILVKTEKSLYRMWFENGIPKKSKIRRGNRRLKS